MFRDFRRYEAEPWDPGIALDFLTECLIDPEGRRALDDGASDLAAALGYEPTALSHAAGYLLTHRETCAEYLARFTAVRERLPELMPSSADLDRYGQQVAVAVLISLDAADTAEPVGLARPALALAAFSDRFGQPHEFWKTKAVARYLSDYRTSKGGAPVTIEQAYDAKLLLERYHLTSYTADVVQIDDLTALVARKLIPDLDVVARAVADALLELWRDERTNRHRRTRALLSCAATLVNIAGDALWSSGGHPLLYELGKKLRSAGGDPVAYWSYMTEQAERSLGDDHPETLTARRNLARSYGSAQRFAEAVSLAEEVVADCVRLYGDDHPETLTARSELASLYSDAERLDDAIALHERVLADRERVLGPDHPDTIRSRNDLVTCYYSAERNADVVPVQERTLADRERSLGADHPDTLEAREELVGAYLAAGRLDEAIALQERVMSDLARLRGGDHRDTVKARQHLASLYWRAGRVDQAVPLQEQVVSSYARSLGDVHPDTFAARCGLAAFYSVAGRYDDAVGLLQRALTDADQWRNDPDVRKVLSTRDGGLFWTAKPVGMFIEASCHMRNLLVTLKRGLGADHPLTVRAASAVRPWGLEE